MLDWIAVHDQRGLSALAGTDPPGSRNSPLRRRWLLAPAGIYL